MIFFHYLCICLLPSTLHLYVSCSTYKLSYLFQVHFNNLDVAVINSFLITYLQQWQTSISSMILLRMILELEHDTISACNKQKNCAGQLYDF